MQIIPKKRYETSVRNAEFEIVSREQKKLWVFFSPPPTFTIDSVKRSEQWMKNKYS